MQQHLSQNMMISKESAQGCQKPVFVGHNPLGFPLLPTSKQFLPRQVGTPVKELSIRWVRKPIWGPTSRWCACDVLHWEGPIRTTQESCAWVAWMGAWIGLSTIVGYWSCHLQKMNKCLCSCGARKSLEARFIFMGKKRPCGLTLCWHIRTQAETTILRIVPQ